METIRQLKAFWAYASRCAQAPANVPACDSFWNWTAVAAAAVIVLIALHILRRMARNFLAVRAERQRLAERARVADPDTMARYRVESEKFYSDPPQEDIQERIRQLLDERKLEDQSLLRPGAGRKREDPG